LGKFEIKISNIMTHRVSTVFYCSSELQAMSKKTAFGNFQNFLGIFKKKKLGFCSILIFHKEVLCRQAEFGRNWCNNVHM
jgi:hypothetical protein